MKKADLQMFYQVALGLQHIRGIAYNADNADVMLKLCAPDRWLKTFLEETGYYGESKNSMPLPDSQKAAKKLLDIVTRVNKRGYADINSAQIMTSDDFALLQTYLENFEAEFARECRKLNAFVVTRKGIYDLEALIERPEEKLEGVVLPSETLSDLREASKALAFELPTASAFHICRATEGLMRLYYKKLTGFDWPPPPPKPKMNRDWKVLADQLRVEGAPRTITQRLDEIREDRNSFAHPDVTVSREDGPMVYELCTNIMFLIAKELSKK